MSQSCEQPACAAQAVSSVTLPSGRVEFRCADHAGAGAVVTR